MKVIPFYYNDDDDLFANTYILIDAKNQCVVIDPSKQYDGIINYIKKNNLTLKGILLTHGHIDHIRGVDLLVNEFNVPVYIGFNEEKVIRNAHYNCSIWFDESYYYQNELTFVSDNENLNLLDERIICIETPYHTQGSICYYFPDSGFLFTGDFLFKGSVGRSDLPTGTPKTLNASMSKLLTLPDITKIYPGHGPSSTLKEEKMSNPYIH